MVEDRIGYRYAKSVFDLAKEKGQLAEVKSDMGMIHELCENSRDFVLMLKSPLIVASKKSAIIEEVFKGKFASKISEYLVDILVRKGREQYLDFVAKSFMILSDIENHITRGVLTSAQPMSESEVAEIEKIIERQTGDSFKLETRVDPELIGGFVLKVGDNLFDGSIASKLRAIKQDFKNNEYIRKY